VDISDAIKIRDVFSVYLGFLVKIRSNSWGIFVCSVLEMEFLQLL
jgi:hypothetical protein